ncbi:3-dehydroquinate synthase family protein [Nocardia sp. R7R-8]|uniref:3-dehydroquinate synthase family protein n=1 Tax=Nocardia sp. R7R-8 TaxID=3459304 RepID=UPI00403D975D
MSASEPAVTDSLPSIASGDLRKMPICLGENSVDYFVGLRCLDEIARHLADLDADWLIIVTDDVVAELHGQSLLNALDPLQKVSIVSHGVGEDVKTLQSMAKYIEAALAVPISRRSVIVSLGGGVPGNLAGVMASILFRGIRLVHIPTTTVAAMDSVLSLKQAINGPGGKNQIGSYYAPQFIAADLDLMRTLPRRELRSGLCEMAKNCLAIAPREIPHLWVALNSAQWSAPVVLNWLLEASIRAKMEVTKDDPFERRRGLVLEYGHTLGHAIELVDHRRRGTDAFSHGESIAIGMLVAARIAMNRGLLGGESVYAHDAIVRIGLGVECSPLSGVGFDEIAAVLRGDNKRGYLSVEDDDQAPFVLLERLGRPVETDGLPLTMVDFDEIQQALAMTLDEDSAAATRGLELSDAE